MTSKQGYGPDFRKFLDKRLHVRLNNKRKVTGVLIGYDHMMNIVLDRTIEHVGKDRTKEIGKAMIRGNSILMWECLDKIL